MVDDSPTQQVWFREICMWQQAPEPWWDEVPGLMALSPLCRQERPPRDALTHAAEAIATKTPDAIQRANLLATLAIFGRLTYPELNVLDLIGSEQMKESPIIEEFQEEARVENARQFILEVLKTRFDRAAARQCAPLLNAISNSRRLTELHRLALRCSKFDQFRKQLEAN
jgi:hypothetical protein